MRPRRRRRVFRVDASVDIFEHERSFCSDGGASRHREVARGGAGLANAEEMNMESSNVAVIVGVGPGLGAALARRFARGGFKIGLIARREESLSPVAEELRSRGATASGSALSAMATMPHAVVADATDPVSLAAGIREISAKLGPVGVLVYNAGSFTPGGILDITPEAFEANWKANCFGAFLASQHVLPSMLARRHGTILFTGATASRRGSARYSALAVGKFGLRALAESMAREYAPQGVHVAHVVIDGQIAMPRAQLPAEDAGSARAPERMLDPDAIAETYFHIHSQPESAWTFEIDIRPAVEKF